MSKKIYDNKFFKDPAAPVETTPVPPAKYPPRPPAGASLEEVSAWSAELARIDGSPPEEALDPFHQENKDSSHVENPDTTADEKFDKALSKADSPASSGSPLLKRLKSGLPINKIPVGSGIIQTDGPEPKISFRPAPGGKKLQKRNAYIIFGKDRPSTLLSGYGAKGAIGCDTIDIVVGRMSSLPNVNTRKKKTYVNNHFGADAARIYISQMTDIDTNFGLDDGMGGNVKARAGIGIKADVVRIIGREGVKIVTGKAPFPGFGPAGELNSRGGKIKQPSPKIELIAGNSSQPREVSGGMFLKREMINTLQPVIAGENLTSALKELTGLLEKIMSAIFNMALIQTAFNSAIAVSPIPHYGPAGAMSATQILDMVVNNIWQTRINTILWESNYCTPYGYKYICSRNVYAT